MWHCAVGVSRVLRGLQAVSLISGSFAEDSAVYYVVGTAYVDPEEREPSKGRILILQVHSSNVQQETKYANIFSVYNL